MDRTVLQKFTPQFLSPVFSLWARVPLMTPLLACTHEKIKNTKKRNTCISSPLIPENVCFLKKLKRPDIKKPHPKEWKLKTNDKIFYIGNVVLASACQFNPYQSNQGKPLWWINCGIPFSILPMKQNWVLLVVWNVGRLKFWREGMIFQTLEIV